MKGGPPCAAAGSESAASITTTSGAASIRTETLRLPTQECQRVISNRVKPCDLLTIAVVCRWPRPGPAETPLPARRPLHDDRLKASRSSWDGRPGEHQDRHRPARLGRR